MFEVSPKGWRAEHFGTAGASMSIWQPASASRSFAAERFSTKNSKTVPYGGPFLRTAETPLLPGLGCFLTQEDAKAELLLIEVARVSTSSVWIRTSREQVPFPSSPRWRPSCQGRRDASYSPAYARLFQLTAPPVSFRKSEYH